jgi:hypothetical protein
MDPADLLPGIIKSHHQIFERAERQLNEYGIQQRIAAPITLSSIVH